MSHVTIKHETPVQLPPIEEVSIACSTQTGQRRKEHFTVARSSGDVMVLSARRQDGPHGDETVISAVCNLADAQEFIDAVQVMINQQKRAAA